MGMSRLDRSRRGGASGIPDQFTLTGLEAVAPELVDVMRTLTGRYQRAVDSSQHAFG
jgi:hypothetical protein